MDEPHPSDSAAQRAAEPIVVAAVANFIGVELSPGRIDLGDGIHVEIDEASVGRSVLVEVYAHVGPLRGSQGKKVATDAFKLVWAGAKAGATRLIIAVMDVDAEAYLRGA